MNSVAWLLVGSSSLGVGSLLYIHWKHVINYVWLLYAVDKSDVTGPANRKEAYIVRNNVTLAHWQNWGRREGKWRHELDDPGLFHLQPLWIYEIGLYGSWDILIKKTRNQQILLRCTEWATTLQFPLEIREGSDSRGNKCQEMLSSDAGEPVTGRVSAKHCYLTCIGSIQNAFKSCHGKHQANMLEMWFPFSYSFHFIFLCR